MKSTEIKLEKHELRLESVMDLIDNSSKQSLIFFHQNNYNILPSRMIVK